MVCSEQVIIYGRQWSMMNYGDQEYEFSVWAYIKDGHSLSFCNNLVQDRYFKIQSSLHKKGYKRDKLLRGISPLIASCHKSTVITWDITKHSTSGSRQNKDKMPPLSSSTTAKTFQRTFSAWSKFRSFARAAEPHPFERYPISGPVAKPDWGRLATHAGRGAVLYVSPCFCLTSSGHFSPSAPLYESGCWWNSSFVPAMVTILTWPLAAKSLLDGNMWYIQDF